MPNRAHSGIRGVPWSICSCCGRDWPTDKLRVQSGQRFGGFIRCPDCFDNPAIEFREELIKQVLENSPQEMEVADILKSPQITDTESSF